MAYSDKVLDHYTNPRNVGYDGQDQRRGGHWAGGRSGMRRRDEAADQGESGDQIIEDAKFKTFGCGSAIASSSLATEWVKGKTVDEALQIKNTEIVKELSLPPVKIHCSVLAEDAIRAAISDWKKKQEVSGRAARIGAADSSLAADALLGEPTMTTEQTAATPANQHHGQGTGARSGRRCRKRAFRRRLGGLRLGVQGGGCSGLATTFASTRSRGNATASFSLATCACLSIRNRSST